MKCRTIFYVNKDDPRIFVYKDQKLKWVGVTLNFAHTASFKILLTTLGSDIIALLPLLIWRNRTAIFISAGLMAAWLVAVLWYYYRQAARDLQKHPGALSAR